MITNNTDCTDKGNVVQAKHELHRALDCQTDTATVTALADWALKWGGSLLSLAEAHEPESEKFERQRDEAWEEIECLEAENSGLEKQIEELEDEIGELKAEIKELESK